MTKNLVRNDYASPRIALKKAKNLKIKNFEKIAEPPARRKIKKKLIFWLLFFAMMITIPLVAVKKSTRQESFQTPIMALNNRNGIQALNANSTNIFRNTDYFCFKDEAQDKILKLSDREFMLGNLASEMPASFEKEALKAQAVAIYTYFCRLRNDFRKRNHAPDAPMFTANSNDWIYFVTDENMREKWKDKFDEYKSKMASAVDEVFGEVLTYKNQLIFAAYHAMSSGMTEKSSEIFGGEDLPYLTNVPCESDKSVARYLSEAEFSAQEFETKIKEKHPDFRMDKGGACPKNISRTNAGSVKKITIGNTELTGKEARNIFGLRSSNFDLKFDDGKFIFAVRGYGHGVGMSQYGAHNMALGGANYREILAKFYPGTTIEKWNS